MVRVGSVVGRRLVRRRRRRLQDLGALVKQPLDVSLIFRRCDVVVVDVVVVIVGRKEDVGKEVLNALVVDLSDHAFPAAGKKIVR